MLRLTGKRIETELEDRNLHSVLPVIRNRAAILSNVADSESLRPQYAAMFNQSIVLLVSYFGAAAHTLFRQGVAVALAAGANVPAATDELKVSRRAVAQAEGDREVMFADLLIAQYDISFQDMQSIRRAFEKHLGVGLQRSASVNDIILGQAGRHVIVHAGGMVDNRMIRQVAGAHRRFPHLRFRRVNYGRLAVRGTGPSGPCREQATLCSRKRERLPTDNI
jgi:hypothetical protein